MVLSFFSLIHIFSFSRVSKLLFTVAKYNKLFCAKKSLAKSLISDRADFYNCLSKKIQELSDNVKIFYEKLIPTEENYLLHISNVYFHLS